MEVWAAHWAFAGTIKAGPQFFSVLFDSGRDTFVLKICLATLLLSWSFD